MNLNAMQLQGSEAENGSRRQLDNLLFYYDYPSAFMYDEQLHPLVGVKHFFKRVCSIFEKR